MSQRRQPGSGTLVAGPRCQGLRIKAPRWTAGEDGSGQMVTEWYKPPGWSQEIGEALHRDGEAGRLRELPDDEIVMTALFDELHRLGFSPLTSVMDLATLGVKYRSAVPALAKALPRVSSRRHKEAIARALAVPFAQDAIPVLVDEFRTVQDESGTGLRWVIGNAIEVAWDDRYFNDLVQLATDASYGRAREMVVLGFRRSKRPEAAQLLTSFLGDDEVAGHAAKALIRVRAADAREPLERLATSSPSLWVRKEAMKALSRLGD